MPITVVSTVVKPSTATSVTLNLAAGGDFPTPPAAGDFVVVAVHYGDDSLIPDFANPTGWSVVGSHQSEDATVTIRGTFRRYAALPETTYTWTAIANGQSGQGFVLLAAVLRNVGNPFVLDPFQQSNLNQSDVVAQATPNSTMAHADSGLIATWGQSSSAVDYSSVSAVNGVSPTVIFGHVTALNGVSIVAQLRAALAIWLAPGAGTWHGFATEGGTSSGRWGSEIFGVRAAVSGSPQRTLVGVGT